MCTCIIKPVTHAATFLGTLHPLWGTVKAPNLQQYGREIEHYRKKEYHHTRLCRRTRLTASSKEHRHPRRIRCHSPCHQPPLLPATTAVWNGMVSFVVTTPFLLSPSVHQFRGHTTTAVPHILSTEQRTSGTCRHRIWCAFFHMHDAHEKHIDLHMRASTRCNPSQTPTCSGAGRLTSPHNIRKEALSQ